MATGGFDPNCIVPVASNITVGTSAVQLKTSSTLAVKFTIVAPPANKLYIGDSTVSATKGIVLAAGGSATFGPDNLIHEQAVSHDLGRYYIICTAAAQVATLVIYSHGGTNKPY